MTATDELRKLLDERGVEWSDLANAWTYETHWKGADGLPVCASQRSDGIGDLVLKHHVTPEQAIAATLGSEINGETSDGYHTFNELYHHRAVLFSVIVRDHSKRAWKARKHHDGTMYDGMFIVGIETPSGQATYHYDLVPYWDMFDCEEREFAPEWDGHTPDEAIARIATLGRGTCKQILTDCDDGLMPPFTAHCSACGAEWGFTPKYCHECGAEVAGTRDERKVVKR